MQKLPNRNNTSFAKELLELLKKIELVKEDPLQYHQRLVHDFVLQYPKVRGLLCYHSLGSGKSILAIGICEDIATVFPDMKVLMLIPKSLQVNMKDDIRKFLQIKAEKAGVAPPSEEEIQTHIARIYQFISLNAGNMLEQVHRSQKPMDLEIDISGLLDDRSEWLGDVAATELAKIKSQGTLEDALVVIDEAHDFFNAIRNDSKNAIGLYNLIMDAKRVKLLFLTGSPIINDPFEIAFCYNMLAGTRIFGEDAEAFERYFVNHRENLDLEKQSSLPVEIKNPEKFANRISGLTSYYNSLTGEVAKKFPTMLPLRVVRVPMSLRQFALYAAARDKEIEEAKRAVIRRHAKEKVPLSYRVRSRQISNFLYPSYAAEILRESAGRLRYRKDINKLRKETFSLHLRKKDQEGKTKTLKQKKKGRGEKVEEEELRREEPLEEKTAEEKPIEEISLPEETEEFTRSAEEDLRLGLETWSPKIVAMLTYMSRHTPGEILKEFRHLDTKGGREGVGPGLVYSQFLDSGVGVFAKALEFHGFREIKNASDLASQHKGGNFCVISGEVDVEVRGELIRAFSSEANKKGELITLLLFTATGAQGLNTKFVRYVIAMEPFWNWSRIDQVFGRAARFESHILLALEDQTVQPYLFLSDYPETEQRGATERKAGRLRDIEDTTDVNIYLKAVQAQALIDSFRRLMQESSIDCAIWSEQKNCRLCKPTGKPLFIEDLDKDMLSPSPCDPLQEEKITVESLTIEIEGEPQEFKYQKEKGGIRVFVFDPRLNGYKELTLGDPHFLEVYEIIEREGGRKKEKK